MFILSIEDKFSYQLRKKSLQNLQNDFVKYVSLRPYLCCSIKWRYIIKLKHDNSFLCNTYMSHKSKSNQNIKLSFIE